MYEPIPPVSHTYFFEEVSYLQGTTMFSSLGYRLDKCQIFGLEVQEAGAVDLFKTRRGRVIIPGGHEIKVESRLPETIPDGDYTLVGGQNFAYCVVARVLPADSSILEKISTLWLSESESQHPQKLINLEKVYCKWAS